MLQNISSKQLVTTLSSKGQVTIPIEVRKHLSIDTNDKVAFVINSSGVVQIKPAKYPNIQSLRGIAGTLKKPLPWKEVERIAHEDAMKKKNMDGKLSDLFLDTNIIVRLLTGDDLKKQADSAKLFEKVADGEIVISSPDAIIAETVFVLSSPNLYHLPRTEIRDALSSLLSYSNFKVDNKQAVIAALDIYANFNIHFIDSLLLALTRQSSEKAFYSYDEGFDKFPDVIRKEP